MLIIPTRAYLADIVGLFPDHYSEVVVFFWVEGLAFNL